MNLDAIIERDQIIPDLRATDRWQAIEELTDQLVATGKLNVDNRSAIVTAIRRRETSMSTGIGSGLAVTLGDTSLIQSPICAFGRSLKGMEYDSLDNQPVKFVLLLIRPSQCQSGQMWGLTDSLRLFLFRNRELLEQATDRNALYDILATHDQEQTIRKDYIKK
jgi:mannitol/fructose-specific phosphotransferase system IIA component (Ntr-type)